MQWVTVLMVAVAGFFGAGAFSMWRTEHRWAAGILAVIALGCLTLGILALLPGSSQAAA